MKRQNTVFKNASVDLKLFFLCRKDDQEVGEEVENVAEAIKENGREEPGPDWALREARLHFTSESPNMGLMKDIASDASISL